MTTTTTQPEAVKTKVKVTVVGSIEDIAPHGIVAYIRHMRDKKQREQNGHDGTKTKTARAQAR